LFYRMYLKLCLLEGTIRQRQLGQSGPKLQHQSQDGSYD
jgi:hypothetical protein